MTFTEGIGEPEFPLIMQEHRERGLLIFPIILRDIADFSRYRELEGIFAYPFDDEGNLTTIEDFKIRDRAYNKIAIKILDLLPKFYKNPYKHLSFFESKDSDNFYGREAISKELANTTLTLNAGLLFGESGVGKTSLILAGVLVELKRVDSFEAVYIRCRKDITKNLREILIQELGSEGVTLREILESYIAQRGSRVLLIFDQFEEMFITVSTREEKKFFKEILFEIKDIDGVHLLFSLRADYLWRLNPYRDEFGELWNRSVGLERLQKEDALRAIAKPLEEERLDNSLALEIYHDLQNESKNEEVDTPFLQLVMFELYTKSIGRNSLKITKKLYDELGGVHGIITNYFDGLLSRFDADEHKSLEKLFFYLVTDSLTRDSLKKSDLEAIFSQKHERKKIYKLIKRLIEDRVVRHVTDIDEYYELVHDILIYQYVLIMAESLLEYVGENLYPVESSQYTEKIEDKLTELYIILAFKITEDIEYEKLYERLENLLLDGGFEFNGTLLVDAFINQAHPPQLNTKVAFDLASAIPDESLDIIVARLNEEDDILRQNAYALLRYRFDDVLEMDLEEYSDIGYDEINLFLNFDRDKRIFQELSLSHKDIQIKRLEDYFDPSLAYKQFVVWEKNLDNRLQQLNSTIDKSLKNIMVGSLDMIDKDFRTIKSSLDSFLSFFKIELMIDKLIKLNSTTLRHYKEEIEQAFKIYTDTQIKNQKKGVENLVEVINIYRELEKEVEVLSDKKLLSDIRADIKFMGAYIEAKNIDIALDYWLGYITDVVYLLVKEHTQESLELKEKLLEKMIRLNMYDNIKILFKDITSRSNKLDLRNTNKTTTKH